MFGGPSFKLFSVLGFRVGAHWTLPIALVIAAVTHGGAAGVALAALLFASILAHELGHAVVARRLRVPIAGIDLHMFGGVAKMQAPPRSPNDEIAISIAGPIVSLALAGFFLLLRGAAPVFASSTVVLWLASANLALGVFNLLPALPLDGGRVFRALLAKRKGLVRGTELAVTVSRVLAVALGVLGALTNPWLIAIAVLVWSMGSAELRAVTRHDAMLRMGAWHPADVPWVRYEVAAERERQRGRPGSTSMPLEPDVIILPPR
jgi:Zn-dependent protease